jgi:transposase
MPTAEPNASSGSSRTCERAICEPFRNPALASIRPVKALVGCSPGLPAKGNPLTFDVTGGEVHEVKGYDALMQLHEIDPAKLIGDKGYDSDGIRNDLAARGIEPVIPLRSNRNTPIEYDREAYKRRNLIERCVNRLKQFRRIATRYEKTARASLSMLCVAVAKLWIKTVNTA